MNKKCTCLPIEQLRGWFSTWKRKQMLKFWRVLENELKPLTKFAAEPCTVIGTLHTFRVDWVKDRCHHSAKSHVCIATGQYECQSGFSLNKVPYRILFYNFHFHELSVCPFTLLNPVNYLFSCLCNCCKCLNILLSKWNNNFYLLFT